MQPINIFRAGTHTSAGGESITFTPEQLREMADSYDPALHEAPIVVGHPKDNAPAFGWVGGVSFSDDGNVSVNPDQVDEQFGELVKAGRYKKVSASFYTPNSPANPTPGRYYLRHVGFLGAMPPAIKGLDGVSFNENDEYLEFEESYEKDRLARLFRGMREFFISKFSVEDADSVLPAYVIEGLEDSAREALDKESKPYPAFNEDLSAMTMTPEEIKAAEDKLAADREALDAEKAAHADAMAQFAEKEAAANKAELTTYIDAQIEAGRILPAQKDEMIAFAESLGDVAVEFGEGEEKVSALDKFKSFVEAMPKKVDFNEKSGGDEEINIDETPKAIADKAVEYKEAKAKLGTTISYTQAVTAVKNGTDQV